jgi:RTX calcium-binding nonapeptide repeat (4 copies)
MSSTGLTGVHTDWEHGTNYEVERDWYLQQLENRGLSSSTDMSGLRPHFDGGNSIAIGYGFDLLVPSDAEIRGYLGLLSDALQLTGAQRITLSGSDAALLRQVRETARPTRTADERMATREYVQSVASQFALNLRDEPAAALLLTIMLNRYEDALTAALCPETPLIQSHERIAVISMLYQRTAPTATAIRRICPHLLAALRNDNRAEAWYELRYNSDPRGNRGSRPRTESDYFELYDAGDWTDEEAKEVMRMYTSHYILETDPARTPPQADINAQVAPGKNYLINNFAQGRTIDGQVMVGKGLASYQYLEGDNYANYGDDITGSNQNDLIFGERGIDRLNGADGADVIYGGEGNDYIRGGRGDDSNDLLCGGEGNDFYYVYTGDGTDRIEDKEGNNKVFFNDRPILTFIEQRHGMEYRYVTTDGFFGGDYQGSDFVVTEIVSGTQVILNEDFQEGDFGIQFYDELTPPDNPVTDNEWPGDQIPEHPNDGFYGTTSNELILCGAGDDWVEVWGDENWIKGGDGDDLLEGESSTNSIIEGGAGSDVLFGSYEDGPGLLLTQVSHESRADLTPPRLHQICTKSPRILHIFAITVARTDAMLKQEGQGNALWTLSRIRRVA